MDESPEAVKELGNAAVKNQKYEEAILHYSHAIKLDPSNYTLYSNRSFAFLKVQQYHLALEDALETIRLNPSWPKGYFRKAEIEFATKHYAAALESYGKAWTLQPTDSHVMAAIEKTNQIILNERKADKTTPWIGAGIGTITGLVIVIADFIFTNEPTHPFLMAFLTIVITIIGYALGKGYRFYLNSEANGLLQPPPDLMESEEPSAENKAKPRYTKSQARQRYKKGKL